MTSSATMRSAFEIGAAAPAGRSGGESCELTDG
jgi:hypothetical protein